MSSPLATEIHPTAVVQEGAELGLGVRIGPYAVIGPRTQLGDGVIVDAHTVIQGRTVIGARTHIWPFASLGTSPQDLKYRGEDTELVCGADNMIREYVNISIGTEGGGGRTVIGNANLLMVNTHIAHDCIIGDHCIFANGVSLGGHVEVGDRAVIGGHAAIHQFVHIGKLAMLAGGSIVVQDVPPFCTVHGNHAVPHGLNVVGLKRAGYSRQTLAQIKGMYKILYQSQLTIDDATAAMESDLLASDERQEFIRFLQESQRGICR